MKKFITMLLAVAMVLSLGSVALADTVVSNETDLKTAILAGGEVTLGADIALTDPIVIEAGNSVTLNLGEFALTYTSAVPGEDMITNKGTLVINGGTNGRISYTNTDTTAGNVTVSTISNTGSLTVNGGTVENLSDPSKGWVTDWSTGIFPYAIDSLGAASLTVTGGAVKSTYRSVRQFVNTTTTPNSLTITGGEFIGQIWTQSPNSNANKASLNISGGSFQPTGNDGSSVFITNSAGSEDSITAQITNGTFATKIGATNPTASGVAGCVTGGNFTENAENNTNDALFAQTPITGGSVVTIVYYVGLAADPVAGGTVQGDGYYAKDSSVTITATPNSGYAFAKWVDNGTDVSTSASYTFTITQDCDFSAQFVVSAAPPVNPFPNIPFPLPEPPAVTPDVNADQPPVVTAPVQDQIVWAPEGGSGSMSVAGENADSYQWFVDRGDGEGFVPIEGAINPTYNTSGVKDRHNGYRYFCQLNNRNGATSSPIFTLAVMDEAGLPKTGESANSLLWLGLALAGLIGMTAITVMGRKERN